MKGEFHMCNPDGTVGKQGVVLALLITAKVAAVRQERSKDASTLVAMITPGVTGRLVAAAGLSGGAATAARTPHHCLSSALLCLE